MSAQTIMVQTKAAQGDHVDALNYKLRPPRWESGKVISVGCGIRKDGTYHVSYDILLDRRSTGSSRMFREGGGPLRLTVGDDGIHQ